MASLAAGRQNACANCAIKRSALGGRPKSEPLQILIVWRRIGVVNDLAVRNSFAGPCIHPFVGFDVIIRKTQHTRVKVQARGIMEKNVLRHIDAESRRADVGRVDIGENEAHRRHISGELGRSGVIVVARIRSKRFLEAAGGGADVTIQRITANLRLRFAADKYCGLVCRAFVDLRRSQIRGKQRVAGIEQELGIDKSRQKHVIISQNPQIRTRGARLAATIRHQHLAVIP